MATLLNAFAFAFARPSPLIKTIVLYGHGDKDKDHAFKQIRHCTMDKLIDEIIRSAFPCATCG